MHAILAFLGNDDMPTTPKCFEPDFGTVSPIPHTPVPSNWLNLLAKTCLASSLGNSVSTLEQELESHFGSNSNFAYKVDLETKFKEIYQRMTAVGEYELSPNLKAAIAIKIQEDISQCTRGFYNRVILICQSFSIPYNLKALLTQLRHDVVNKAAIDAIANTPYSDALHVHIYNQFFLIASQLYGVQMIQQFDSHTGNIPHDTIAEQLQEAFDTNYTSPLSIIKNLSELIKAILEKHYFYSGRKETGCITADVNNWSAYLEKIGIPYGSCSIYSYPYTNKAGQCALIRSSSSPASKSVAELKAMLNNHGGIIFFENTLYFTDYSAETKNSSPIKIFYAFSDEGEDKDALKIKEQFLALPLDAGPKVIYLASRKQVDNIRTSAGMEGIAGTMVDLNWNKITNSLLNILIKEDYLKPSLNSSEELLTELLQDEFMQINMIDFRRLVADDYLCNINKFIQFLELFPYLSLEKKTQFVKEFLNALPEEHQLSALIKLVPIVGKDLFLSSIYRTYFKKFNVTKIALGLGNQLCSNQAEALIKVHDFTKKYQFLSQPFTEYLNNYAEADLFQHINDALISGTKVFATLSLLDCIEQEKQIRLLTQLLNIRAARYMDKEKLEPILKLIGHATPLVQAKFLKHANQHNDNLLMSMLYFFYGDWANPELITQLLALIARLDKADISDIFLRQDRNDQNNALFYAYQKMDTLKFIVPILEIISILPEEDQQSIFGLMNSTKQNVLELAAASENTASQLKITKMIGNFSLPYLYTYLEKWNKLLISSRTSNQVAELFSEFFTCLEETKRSELLILIFGMNDSTKVFLFQEPFTLLNFSLPLLKKTTLLNLTIHFNPIQLANISDVLIKLKRPDLALDLLKRCYPTRMPLKIKNNLLSEAIASKNNECALEILILGADVTRSMFELAIQNQLIHVVDAMLDRALPNTLKKAIRFMSNQDRETYSPLLKKAMLKHPTTYAPALFKYSAPNLGSEHNSELPKIGQKRKHICREY